MSASWFARRKKRGGNRHRRDPMLFCLQNTQDMICDPRDRIAVNKEKRETKIERGNLLPQQERTIEGASPNSEKPPFQIQKWKKRNRLAHT